MSDPQDNCTHGTPGHIACVECWQDRAKELKADIQCMVEKAADNSLDGYRELGARCAEFEGTV